MHAQKIFPADIVRTAVKPPSEEWIYAATPRQSLRPTGIAQAEQRIVEYRGIREFGSADGRADAPITIAGGIRWSGRKFGKASYRADAAQAWQSNRGRTGAALPIVPDRKLGIARPLPLPTLPTRPADVNASALRVLADGLAADAAARAERNRDAAERLGIDLPPAFVVRSTDAVVAKVAKRKTPAMKACKRTVKL